MRRMCDAENCHMIYDDVERLTYCPHDKVWPSDGNPWGILSMIGWLSSVRLSELSLG